MKATLRWDADGGHATLTATTASGLELEILVADRSSAALLLDDLIDPLGIGQAERFGKQFFYNVDPGFTEPTDRATLRALARDFIKASSAFSYSIGEAE